MARTLPVAEAGLLGTSEDEAEGVGGGEKLRPERDPLHTHARVCDKMYRILALPLAVPTIPNTLTNILTTTEDPLKCPKFPKMSSL